MRKICLLLLLIIHSATMLSQISFEEGYFITNDGEKRNCLIKNLDWLNNPTSFDYKNLNNPTIYSIGISDVKEFSINNGSTFIRKEVAIEQSPVRMDNLSQDRNPVFTNTTVFLREYLFLVKQLYTNTWKIVRGYFLFS